MADGCSIATRLRPTPRRQMVAIGVIGAVLNLVLVRTALVGLDRVDRAYQAVEQMSAARFAVLDAGAGQDVLRGDVLGALAVGGSDRWAAAVKRDAARVRADITAAWTHPLLPREGAELARQSPAQSRAVAEAEQLVALADRSPAEARQRAGGFLVSADQLRQDDSELVRRLGAAIAAVQAGADTDERRAARWIIGAAAAALVGFLVLALLVTRLGRRVGVMVARERGVAETLQRSLLPERLPEVPGMALAARYVPGAVGNEVGGDWYDVFPLAGGRIGLVMGDVAGHDLTAAVAMGQMRHALRAYCAEGHPPDVALSLLNALCLQHHPGDLATCLLVVVDPVQGGLHVVNAGHYPPLMVREGRPEYLESQTRPPVGARREAQYPVQHHPFPPGSTLLLYTDGLVEQRGVDVSEGLDLLAALVAAAPADVDELCGYLLRTMPGAVHGGDDVALLAVQLTPRSAGGLELRLPAEPGTLSALRHAVDRWLDDVGADELERYELVMATNEAASNAVEHAYGPGAADYEVCCTYDATDRQVTVVVADTGRWREPRGQGRGRGLMLMRAVTHEVRVTRGEPGTGGTVVELRRALGRPAVVDEARVVNEAPVDDESADASHRVVRAVHADGLPR